MHDDDYISEIAGDVSKDLEIIEIPELLIHGNAARCWQNGWGVSNYGLSGYSWKDFPVCGIQDPEGPNGTVMRLLKNAYHEASGIEDISPNGGHSGGNPGIVMYLKIKDFKRDLGGTLSCKIDRAYIRSNPGPLGLYGRRGYSSSQWPMYGSGTPEREHKPKWFFGTTSEWNSVCDKLSRTRHNCSPSGITLWPNFPCNFDIMYDFIVDGHILKSGTLIKRRDKQKQWSEPLCDTRNVMISAYPVSFTSESRIIFAIRNDSDCHCDQTNKSMPIFAVDITNKFKKQPYVWRRFGSSKTEDPQGYDISPTLCDGKWHLVEPFYYIKGGKWKSVEKEDE